MVATRSVRVSGSRGDHSAQEGGSVVGRAEQIWRAGTPPQRCRSERDCGDQTRRELASAAGVCSSSVPVCLLVVHLVLATSLTHYPRPFLLKTCCSVLGKCEASLSTKLTASLKWQSHKSTLQLQRSVVARRTKMRPDRYQAPTTTTASA